MTPAGSSYTGPLSPERKRVFLHVGAPKSGTSYIQSRFNANKSVAADQGLLWTVPWRDQVEAVKDLKSLGRRDRLARDGAWTRLVDRVRSWQGSSVLISMEWLMNAQEHHVSAALSSLEPARVEVVCTARDLVRVLPATWQESTQNTRTWRWDEYLRAIVDPTGPRQPAAIQFFDNQDVPAVLRRWRAHLPAEQVHLVTVPAATSGSDVLWERFCSVLGLHTAHWFAPDRGNPSLGVVSACLLQRLNVAAQERRLSRHDYNRYIKQVVAKQVLAPRRRLEGRIAVPDHVQAWLTARAERMIADLRELTFHLVGDLDELLPQKLDGGVDPSDVSDAEMLDVAVDAFTAFVEIMVAREKSLRRPVGRGGGPGASRAGGRPRASLVRTLADRLSSRMPAGH